MSRHGLFSESGEPSAAPPSQRGESAASGRSRVSKRPFPIYVEIRKVINEIKPSRHPFRYSIDRHTDLERLFNIDSTNGTITTLKALDREMSKWHNISVVATEISNGCFTSAARRPLFPAPPHAALFNPPTSDNPGQTTRVPVFIKVLDVNDNAPEFATSYDTFVCENVKAGQVRRVGRPERHRNCSLTFYIRTTRSVSRSRLEPPSVSIVTLRLLATGDIKPVLIGGASQRRYKQPICCATVTPPKLIRGFCPSPRYQVLMIRHAVLRLIRMQAAPRGVSDRKTCTSFTRLQPTRGKHRKIKTGGHRNSRTGRIRSRKRR